MKKFFKKFFIILFILLIIYTAYRFAFGVYVDYSKKLEINIPVFTVTKHEDTHEGFHGDGSTRMVIALTEEQGNKIKKEIENNPHWYKFENFDEIPMRYHSSMQGECYWFFKDRHSDATDIYDYEDYFNRESSSNYTIAAFDIKANKIYIYEFNRKSNNIDELSTYGRK